MLRLTWVQPEDLLGHELRQAAQDGRDASGVERRWHEAGGLPPPDRAGASPLAQDPRLRALANTLLDELASTQSPLRALEPTSLPEIKQLTSRPVRPSLEDREREGFGAAPTEAPGTQSLHASWLGRAVGCLLGKPVEKLPLHGIRAIARSTSNWPLNTWFTHRGLPRDVAERHPWNRRSRPTSLAENIDGMPEDDDLNYPLLGLLLLRRHGTGFTTEDVARLWLDELLHGPHVHRGAHRVPQSPGGHRAPGHGRAPQPVPGVGRRPDPRGRLRLDEPRRPRPGGRTGPRGRDVDAHGERRVRRDVRSGSHRPRGSTHRHDNRHGSTHRHHASHRDTTPHDPHHPPHPHHRRHPHRPHHPHRPQRLLP